MKKNTLIKLVSAILLCCLGLIMAIMGLSGEVGGYYNSNYTAYEYYGGDAYTGMQQASADAANNTSELGNFAEGVIEQAYIFGGLAIALLGLYLIGCSLTTAEQENPVDAKNNAETTDDSSEKNV